MLRRQQFAAAFVAVGALVPVLLTAAPAIADTAEINGHVLAQETGEGPAGGFCISAYTEDFGWAGGTCTDGSDQTGAFSIPDLDTGSLYRIEVAASGYATTWLPDSRDFDGAQSYSAPSTIEATMQQAAAMSGTLTRSDGSPASDVAVNVYRADVEDRVASAWTDENGTWAVDGLLPGSYKVSFEWGRYWAHGKTDWAGADEFPAVAGSTVTVDEQLPPPTKVSGHVQAAGSGAPVQGVCVNLEDPAEMFSNMGSACTDASGDYVIEDAIPGTWIVRFYDDTGGYAPQWWGSDAPARESAAQLTVPAGVTTTGIDAELSTAAALSGRVIDAASGRPLADVCPSPYQGSRGDFFQNAVTSCSDTQGRWSVRGLPAGDATVTFSANVEDHPYLDTWAYGSSTQARATVFRLAAGETTALRDVKMVLGGVLTGQVTDAATGRPVEGVYVDVNPFGPRAGAGEGRWSKRTGPDGRYTIRGISPGTRTPVAYDEEHERYGWQWAGGATDPATGTSIKFKEGRTSQLNFTMRPGASVTGHVVMSDGSVPETSGMVDVVTYPSGAAVGWSSDYFGGNGAFRVTGLPDGARVLLRFTPNNDEGQTRPATWYEGAVDQAHATVVVTTVTSPPDITAHLRP